VQGTLKYGKYGTELNVLDVSFDRDIMHLNFPFKNLILLHEINNGQKIFKKLTAKINLKKCKQFLSKKIEG